MDVRIAAFFPIFFVLPLLLSGLCYVKSLQHGDRGFRHLSEFFLSLVPLLGASWFLLNLGPAYVILSMLPWLWLLRTMGLVCGDTTKQNLFSRLHAYALIFGGIISIIFLSFDFELPMVTTPISLAVGLIGLSFILQAYTKGNSREYSLLQHFNLGVVLLFFISRLCFPLIVSESARFGVFETLETSLVLIFCVSLYPLYAQEIFEGHVKNLQSVLESRNKQIFGHSGFSEYRILSAGLSHEVNNALSIINARIFRLTNGKTENLTQDLKTIQNASARITRGIRTLRDFIYPVESQEVLDLGEVLQDVLGLYGQRLINHDVRIEVENLGGKLVRGQRIQLEQIFLALINNSVDALDQRTDRWISVSARVLGDEVQVTYQDASASRARQVGPLLKDPLHMHEEFLDNDIRLVLAREIAENHGGYLRCDPRSENSTFILDLPLADALRSTESTNRDKIDEFRELN